MVSRPRIFLSAVSAELGTARRNAARRLRNLGYDPVSQDDFSAGYGELLEWLRREIDSCEGLIQIIGSAYGEEPPEAEPDYGRVSYTQYEFLYARRHAKPTWVIVAGDECPRDCPFPNTASPDGAASADRSASEAEKYRLQRDYLARLTAENHIRHVGVKKRLPMVIDGLMVDVRSKPRPIGI